MSDDYTARVQAWKARLEANPDAAYLLRVIERHAAWIEEHAQRAETDDVRDAYRSARWHLSTTAIGQLAGRITDEIGLPPAEPVRGEGEDAATVASNLRGLRDSLPANRIHARTLLSNAAAFIDARLAREHEGEQEPVAWLAECDEPDCRNSRHDDGTVYILDPEKGFCCGACRITPLVRARPTASTSTGPDTPADTRSET